MLWSLNFNKVPGVNNYIIMQQNNLETIKVKNNTITDLKNRPDQDITCNNTHTCVKTENGFSLFSL